MRSQRLRAVAAELRLRRRRAWPPLALAIVCGTVSACGGGSGVASISTTKSTSATLSASAGNPSASAPYTNALNYARCMRAHGEPGFPDPTDAGGFSTAALERLDAQSPQYVSADATCRRLLPNGGQPTPAEVQQAVTEGLRFARCMRARGVQFPDPGISGSELVLNLSNVDTNSPRYAAASKICATKPGG